MRPQALIDQGRGRDLPAHRQHRAPCGRPGGRWRLRLRQASDMSQFAPTPRISAIVDNWGPFYTERVQAAMDWHLGTGRHLAGASGMNGSPDRRNQRCGPGKRCAPRPWRWRHRSRRANITRSPAPINRQDGSVWLAEGEIPRGWPAGGHQLLRRGADGRAAETEPCRME